MIQFTKIKGGSADPGFEELTDSRRRSLMSIVERIDVRIALSAKIVERMVDDKAFSTEYVRCAGESRKGYESVRDRVLLQFPEVRADRRGSFDHDDALTNNELNAMIRRVDNSVAAVAGVNVTNLRDWFDRDGVAPKPSRLFARCLEAKEADE